MSTAATPSKRSPRSLPLRSPLRTINTNLHAPDSAGKGSKICQRCVESERQNKTLKVAVINGEEEIREWEQTCQKLEGEFSTLQEAYELKCIKVKENGSQIEELKHTILTKEREVENLKSLLVKEQELTNDLKGKVRSQAESHNEQFTRLTALKQSHQALLAEHETLQTEFASFRKKNPGKIANSFESVSVQTDGELFSPDGETRDNRLDISAHEVEVQTILHLVDREISRSPCNVRDASSKVESLTISNDLLREEALALHRELEAVNLKMKNV